MALKDLWENKNMTSKEKKYHKLYLDIAKRVSEMSYAIRLKVGCIIVKDDNIISMGFNGMPSGLENDCETKHFENYDEKGILRGLYLTYRTKDEVLHAECNAISKAARSGSSTRESTMYCTHAPCIQCSKLIQQSGINRLVYLEDYRDSSGIELLKRCNIEVIKFTNEDGI